jgi:hypothetical protein
MRQVQPSEFDEMGPLSIVQTHNSLLSSRKTARIPISERMTDQELEVQISGAGSGLLNPRLPRVSAIEQIKCRMPYQLDIDSCCKRLLDSVQVAAQDPRYKCLHRRVDVEAEDNRCSTVSIEMEDTRCKGLASKW